MKRLALLASLLLVAPIASAGDADVPAPYDQFDFWLGEWSVNNRFLQPDVTWKDAGTSRARITPVLGGRAVFEEWAGELEGRGTVIGISLRAFDPSRDKWRLLLNWPGGQSSFGTLEGSFRHGRGEFFAGGGRSITRYSFSDALADTVRWDSARSQDGGVTWNTDWIMEFSRTAPRAENDDALFRVAWEDERTAPAACRAMDFLVGEWRGVQELHGADGTIRERETTLRAAAILRGWVTVAALEPEGAPEDESFTVFGWVSASNAWEAWSLRAGDTRMRRAHGSASTGEASFRDAGPDEARRTSLVASGDDGLTLETMVEANEAWRLAAVTHLARVTND